MKGAMSQRRPGVWGLVINLARDTTGVRRRTFHGNKTQAQRSAACWNWSPTSSAASGPPGPSACPTGWPATWTSTPAPTVACPPPTATRASSAATSSRPWGTATWKTHVPAGPGV